MEKFILLGASRGLGWETYKILHARYPQAFFLISSRKIEQKKNELLDRTVIFSQDFSKPEFDLNFIKTLQDFKPTCVIYFAGGGPYGKFQSKKWSDHKWALQTSFLYPAELTHHILSEPAHWPALLKIVLIGSSVAEQNPDPLASSYSAAKHALKGLVESVNAEQSPFAKLLLFSPPYMLTDMLPVNSHPRLNDRAENPLVVAERLIEYIEKA